MTTAPYRAAILGPTQSSIVPVVLHLIGQAAAVQVHALHLGAVERARAEPAEDGDLVAGLVDRAVAVEALGHRERRRGRARPGDQLRHRPRARSRRSRAGVDGEVSWSTRTPFRPSAT